MYISLFLETSDTKEALYQKEFKKKRNQTKDICVVSSEYCTQESENLVVIPERILGEIDEQIKSPAYRDVILKVKRFETFETWLEELVETKEKIDGILSYGLYYSVLILCKKYDIPIYIVGNEVYEYSHNWGEERLRNQYVDLKEQLELMKQQKETIERELDLLKEYKESSDKHLNELQAKISLLTVQLQQYRERGEGFDDERKELEEEIEKLRESNCLYIKMYKDELEKVNENKIRILQLEKDMKHKG